MHKKCPKCGTDHSKTGLFCSRSCANSRKFSEESKIKKSESNKNYWKKLTAEEQRRKIEVLYKTSKQQHKIYWDSFKKEHFESLGNSSKKKVLYEERGEKCEICGISEWTGKKLSLHLDHIDGNRNNNNKSNLRILCPNCHSLTPTYARKNQIPHNKGKKYIKKETKGNYV